MSDVGSGFFTKRPPLHGFYEHDAAENFRGQSGRVIRQEFHTPEVVHIDELNECIEASRATGYGCVSPECGLNYICLRRPEAVEKIAEHVVRDCIVVMLNERKAAGEWAPYYPFTLSIRDGEALFDFIDGNYSILITLHVPTLIDLFRKHGLNAEIIDDDSYAVQLSRPGAIAGQDLISKLSRQMFFRIFFEFQSVGWFAQMQSESFAQIEQNVPPVPPVEQQPTPLPPQA